MSFLTKIAKIRETLGADYQLIGDVLLIESLPSQEIKTASGLVIASGDNKNIDGFDLNRTNLVRVIGVGEGYYDDETKESVSLESKEGDIVMVAPLSIKWLSTFGPILSTKDHQIGITRESEIQIRFKNGSYEKALELLK